MILQPKVFFIGQNRTATKSLSRLFIRGGYKSWHYSYHFDTDPSTGLSIAEKMKDNKAAGKDPLYDIAHAEVYSDMHFHRDDVWYDGIKDFQPLYTQYPNAYFIMQTRPMEDWLLSKKNHKDGAYIERCCEYHGKNVEEMLEWFREERLAHEERVRYFFAGPMKKKYANFLEWDLEEDSIDKIIEFVKPDFKLDSKYWENVC